MHGAEFMEQNASVIQEIPALKETNISLSCVQQSARERTNPDHIQLGFQKRLLYRVLLGDEHKTTKSGAREGNGKMFCAAVRT
jgi:hypothetical protein